MILTLLRNEFARARRNPWGLLLSLAIPLMITGLVGSLFGPKSKSGGVPVIHLAVVDEDQSVFGGFVMGALDRQQDGRRHFQPIACSRAEAEAKIRNDEISAVIILPKDFSVSFLKGETPPPIELIKNPAQLFLPLIVEELLSVVTEVLDAASKNLGEDMQGFVQELDEDEMPDFVLIAKSIEQIGKKFEKAEEVLLPPLIEFGVEERAKKAEKPKSGGGAFNIFGFLLPGLAAMFLLFIADSAAQELYRDRESGMLDRIRSYHSNILPVLISKAVSCCLLLLVSGGILFGAGSVVFGISWQHPLQLCVLVICYSVFAAGLILLISAFMKTRKRAGILNNIVIMLIAFLGGGLIPANNLPDAIVNNISPWLPNFWFAEAIKALEFGMTGPAWWPVALKLLLIGAVLIGLAAQLFNRLFSKGLRT